MILINAETNEQIVAGDKVTNFRGETYFLHNFRAGESYNSSGRVGLNNPDGSFAGEFFPSVIGAIILTPRQLIERKRGNL